LPGKKEDRAFVERVHQASRGQEKAVRQAPAGHKNAVLASVWSTLSTKATGFKFSLKYYSFHCY
jgi:hypothetical protein